MSFKDNNIEIVINDQSDEVVKELLQSLLSRHPIGLETSMKGGDFIFDCVHVLRYKCHEINFKCGRSNIDSPDWIKTKKATINLANKKDSRCFQYAITAAINHEVKGKHHKIIIGIKPFINKYN